MDRIKAQSILLEKPSPKTRFKSKAKVNGKGMEKGNHTVTKVKEIDEEKGNKDSEMKERKNPQ